jgi:hypothetical protein
MKCIKYGLLASLFLIISCTATKSSFNEISKEQFEKKINSILVTPTQVNIAIGSKASISELFSKTIESNIEIAGYDVIGLKEHNNIATKYNELLMINSDSLATYTQLLWHDRVQNLVTDGLKIKYSSSIDAVCSSYIVKVVANHSGGNAYWHGASESLISDGNIAGKALSTLGNMNTSGTVSAVSLGLYISDKETNLLYKKYGGIQVMFKRGLLKPWINVPKDELFRYHYANTKAVQYALGELLPEIKGE